ncbi:MAG: beta-lactamase domain protein [Gemmatimonadetes bacterium]|nr:beta-lactamase domain protein [Gemmatimonadota bacterium]
MRERGRFMPGGVLALALAMGVASPRGARGQAAKPCVPGSSIRTCVDQLQPNAWVFRGQAGSVVLYSGQLEAIVVGVPDVDVIDSLASFIRARKLAPVKRMIVFDAPAPALLRAVHLAGDSVSVFVHERVRERLASRVAVDTTGAVLPMGFSDVIQLTLEGEEIHAVHQPTGYASSDLLVHFERSGIVVFGLAVTSGSYPEVNAARAGDINGIIASVDRFVKYAGRSTFVPGRGAPMNAKDLSAYHAALIQVRDAISALVARGGSLESALAIVHLRLLPALTPQDQLAERGLVTSAYNAAVANKSGHPVAPEDQR